MTNNISDFIERYLKKILQQSQSGVVELQRSELAELFQCVPSQINYVISTRFSVEHGYLVESKRGGGGYIRIRQIELDETEPLLKIVESVGVSLSQREADGIVERLQREEVITPREGALIRAALRRDSLSLNLPYRDELRARLLAAMLVALASFTEADETGSSHGGVSGRESASTRESAPKGEAASARGPVSDGGATSDRKSASDESHEGGADGAV